MPTPTDLQYFPKPADLRRWFARHHASAKEVWVGFYKKDSDRESITWPESVAEALCVGWIDGIRKSLDAESYTIRFTPRKAGSIWSAVNMKMAEELIAAGKMKAPGLAAYERRLENRSGIYAYEQRSAELPEEFAEVLRADAAAWADYQKRPPSYRKRVNWWVLSAKTEVTRRKRLQQLLEASAEGRTL
jgi:uncharacterized protein YdeI (YjbR/CyaY-like superfamily)